LNHKIKKVFMTEENIEKLKDLYEESDGTSFWEVLFDNFSYEEIIGRPLESTPELEVIFSVQRMDSLTGTFFDLNYNYQNLKEIH